MENRNSRITNRSRSSSKVRKKAISMRLNNNRTKMIWQMNPWAKMKTTWDYTDNKSTRKTWSPMKTKATQKRTDSSRKNSQENADKNVKSSINMKTMRVKTH